MRTTLLLSCLMVGGFCLLPGDAVSVTAADGANTFKIDDSHSTVTFRIKHLGVSHFYGRFNDVSGSMVYVEESPESSSFNVSVNAASVDTNSDKRDKHLRSPDFFNAKEFRTISFASTQVSKLDNDHLKVTGDLTFHGVTKSVTVEMHYLGSTDHPKMGFRNGFETEVTIKRSDFGVTAYPDALGDEVKLTISLEGIRI